MSTYTHIIFKDTINRQNFPSVGDAILAVVFGGKLDVRLITAMSTTFDLGQNGMGGVVAYVELGDPLVDKDGVRLGDKPADEQWKDWESLPQAFPLTPPN